MVSEGAGGSEDVISSIEGPDYYFQVISFGLDIPTYIRSKHVRSKTSRNTENSDLTWYVHLVHSAYYSR